MAETITYSVSIDGGTATSTGSTRSFNISSLSPGQHTISVSGTCQHGTTKTASMNFTIPNIPTGYEYYILKIGWSSSSKQENICLMGIYVNGSTISSSSITGGKFSQNGSSSTSLTSTEISNACASSGQGCQKYGNWIEFNIEVSSPTSFGFHTNQWYQPSGTAIMTIYGVNNGTRTELNSEEISLNTNTTYTLTIS